MHRRIERIIRPLAKVFGTDMADFISKPLSKVVRIKDFSRGSKEYDSVIAETAKVLENGGLVGVPTDTIYGIACLASISQSVKNIYELKGNYYYSLIRELSND